MKSTLYRALFVATIAGVIAGCGGGGGGGAVPAAAPAPAPAPGTTLPAAPVPTGTATVNVANLSAAQLAALTPSVVIGGAIVTSPPQVSFAIQDASNNPIIGFGATTGGNLTYLRFAIAKLVPEGSLKEPSKWVNYMVINADGTARRPHTENHGTLVDNGNGTYTYTFANDITRAKDLIAAMTFTGNNRAADLGDLTFDPNLTHRLAIQLSGGGMENPVNAIYDFIPATGQAVTASNTQREVVSIDTCNQCHRKLAIHGAARLEAKYCVVCHTDQRKYGRANVTSTANAFPALVELAVVDSTTGYTRYLYSKNTDPASSSYHPTGTDPTYVGDGETMGDFTRLVHKIHQGGDLIKQNYNYANLVFNNKHFSMLSGGQRSCLKCHDNTKAAQADNWFTKPSRLACGACHDGINFATGTGTSLTGATTGHGGGSVPGQANDSLCATCHSETGFSIKAAHQTTDVTKHNPTVKTGLVTFTYEIAEATVDGSNNLSIKFRIKADGTAITRTDPVGFDQGPSFLLAWARTQDGIATPIDFNNVSGPNDTAYVYAHPISPTPAVIKGDAPSISLATLRTRVAAATPGYALAGPDGSGYFTATIPSADAFPSGAKMRTVALQGSYRQLAATNSIGSNTSRHAISVTKTVTGDTARREVIDPAKCTNCHEWLKLHGGSRVLAPETTGTVVCVTCHVPGKATSGRGITDTVWDTCVASADCGSPDTKILAEWGISPTETNRALKLPVTTNNFKDMIHGIHKGRERVNPFQDARDRTGSTGGPLGTSGAITLLDFRRLDFPGQIKYCETCHKPNTYNTVSASGLASTYESINATYAAGIAGGTQTPTMAKNSLDRPNPEDKVTSPFAAACVSCHDSTAAQAHMATQGGKIQVTRSAFATAVATPGQGEACATCHGPGRAEDIAVKHK